MRENIEVRRYRIAPFRPNASNRAFLREYCKGYIAPYALLDVFWVKIWAICSWVGIIRRAPFWVVTR